MEDVMELPIEEGQPEEVPPVIEPKKVVKKVIPDPVPDVDLVFDKDEADAWLKQSSRRLKKVFYSVRFEPEGMPERHLPFLLKLAAESVSHRYKKSQEDVPTKGYFYCPLEWAEEAENYLQQTGKVGGYAIFQPRD